MPDQAAAADTAQKGWLIEMTDEGYRTYLSLSEGRALGRPAGAWTPDDELALRFHREQDGRDYAKAFLNTEAPFINVVPFKGA